MNLNAYELASYSPRKAKFCRRAVVKIDGHIETYCSEADDVLGFVVRYPLDQNGNMIVENGKVKTEKRFGRVEIIDPLGEYKE